MKAIHFFCIILTNLMIVSCNDFLDNLPKGEKIPTTLADFTELMSDEYTNCREDVSQAVLLLNDRFESPSNLNYYPLYRANYLWDTTIDRLAANKSDEATYYNSYAAISTANLIIEHAESAADATTAERKEAIAQAKILRAMKYFTLINYYSKTYDASTAADDGGVPYITSAEVGAAWKQESVQDIYNHILDDIRTALPDLPEKSRNVLYADKAAGYALAARVALQMNNYTDALANAQEALARNSQLFDWVAFYRTNSDILGNAAVYQTVPSPMGFNYVENYNFCHGSASYQTSDSRLRVDRAARFEQGDAAFMSRWKRRTVGNDTYYYANLNGYFNKGGLTTTEIYLIKAECLARKGNIAEAMDVLNTVRKSRILPEEYLNLTAENATDAIRKIRDVKADALILTIVPFCDARRMNLERDFARTFTKTENGQNCTLTPDSYLWIMPFPQGAMTNPGNGKLTQNVQK